MTDPNAYAGLAQIIVVGAGACFGWFIGGKIIKWWKR